MKNGGFSHRSGAHPCHPRQMLRLLLKYKADVNSRGSEWGFATLPWVGSGEENVQNISVDIKIVDNISG